MTRVDIALTAVLVSMIVAVAAAGFVIRPGSQEFHPAVLTSLQDARPDEKLQVLDRDGDGLPDILENRLSSTDLDSTDSDGDGMTDAWEFELGLNPNDASDAMLDPDLDGLPNLEEFLESLNRLGTLGGEAALIAKGLKPLVADTDGDGIPDGAEIRAGLDPLDGDDGARDSDGDGLTNYEEYVAGSDPTLRDTDGDGLDDFTEVTVYRTSPISRDTDRDSLPDAWEISVGLNPLDAGDRFGDPDDDGLDNSQEYAARTNPRDADTDKDGMPDAWELNFGLDPLNAIDAGQDPDNDGRTNRDEYRMLFSIYARSTEPLDADTDDDGLDDGAEAEAGSDPFNQDTDGDGLSDFEEVKVYGTDPLKADSDGDDLLDAEEVFIWFTNPMRFDTDLDGLGDGAEVEFWKNRLNQALADLAAGVPAKTWLVDLHPGFTAGALANLYGPTGDLDGDGRSNLLDSDSDADSLPDGVEVKAHKTDPAEPDTDGDEMPDGWEVRYGLDPLDPADADLDSDGDGVEVWTSTSNPGAIVVTPITLDFHRPDARWDTVAEVSAFTNIMEFKAGTNPTSHDTDCDGIPDGWEVYYSRADPRTGLLIPDPTTADVQLDPDNDGERQHEGRTASGDFTVFEEWWFFTDPQNFDTDGDELPDGYEVWLATGDPANGVAGEWGLPANGLSQIETLTQGCVVR